LSKQRTKAQSKRRRRHVLPLTPEERVTLELARMCAEDKRLARGERSEARIISVMLGDHQDYRKPKKNEFDRWELCELMRRNDGKHGDELILRLSGDAYNAKRLGCYC
jgi:hypothetical protein